MRTLMVILALMLGQEATQAQTAQQVPMFSDVAFDNYKYGWGTTAIFDSDPDIGTIKDVCGEASAWYSGRAYDNHHGWDRDIPNDGEQYVVFSPAPGIVQTVRKGCIDGYQSCNDSAGNYVVINHGGAYTSHHFHARPDSIQVKEGDWIDRYTPLFLANNTGHSTGDHSHFEIRLNGIAVDPLGENIEWVVHPIINLSKCVYTPNNQTQYDLVNPYTLKEYADDMINRTAANYTSSEIGQVSKETYWLFGSNGYDKKDVVAREYSGGSEFPYGAIIVFDLTENASTAFAIPLPYKDLPLGKPITGMYISDAGVFETDFRDGYETYREDEGLQRFAYKGGFAPGAFEDSWHAGKSYAFSECFSKNGARPKVGEPFTSNSGEKTAVHDWAGYMIQGFNGGELGECAIVMHDHGAYTYDAHLLSGNVWTTYKNNGGPSHFGSPITDEYEDSTIGMQKQDFEKGMSILENGSEIAPNYCIAGEIGGEAIPGEPCVCLGEKTLFFCGACGHMHLVCENYIWNDESGCEDEKVNGCVPEAHEKTQVSCSDGLTKERFCDMDCIWGSWSECKLMPSKEVCDNKDNDLDGATDEGLSQACASDCGIGEKKCVSGQWSECDAPIQNVCKGCTTLSGKIGDACGNCGHTACDGTDGIKCANEGVCKNNETQTESCGISGPYCGSGTRTRTCENCAWSEFGTCSASQKYGFDNQVRCDSVICVQITSVSETSASFKITKVGGQVFTINPVQWYLMDRTLNKVLKSSPGWGCDSYYGGQTEIVSTFNPSDYNISLDDVQAEVYSGGLTCATQYNSGYTHIQKCK